MKLWKKKKKQSEKPVEYHVHIDGCDIKFRTNDIKRYKHIELCLTGIAKLLNLVEENDDWIKFTGLMDAVVEELADYSMVAKVKTPIKVDYVI